MSATESRHAHRLVKHRNKKRYNLKGAISNRRKIWIHRNNLWVYKRIYAYWLIQKHRSFGPHGSNQLEQHHSTIKKSLTYLQSSAVGLNRLPAVAAIGKLKINWTRVLNILQINKQKLKDYAPNDLPMLNQIYNKLDTIRGFNELHKCHDETGWATLYLKCSRNINDYFMNFNWQKSVRRRTRVSHMDKELIWIYIDKYIDEIDRNNGILKNEKVLEEMVSKLRHRLDIQQIRHYISTYWFEGESSESETEDGGGDGDGDNKSIADGEDGMYDLSRLSSKQKKHP